jgi:quercetin dioxygenase-like cupin family protein
MRIFELSENGYSPRHSHEWEHEIIIHSGKGEVLSDGNWVSITKGHAIFIPGNEDHQIRNTGTDPLVFVCLIPSGAPEL